MPQVWKQQGQAKASLGRDWKERRGSSRLARPRKDVVNIL